MFRYLCVMVLLRFAHAIFLMTRFSRHSRNSIYSHALTLKCSPFPHATIQIEMGNKNKNKGCTVDSKSVQRDRKWRKKK